jgi:iron complex transport system ATP-binding protein
MNVTALLRIQNATVKKGRDHRPVLDDLTLEIREGQHTAILGPNGSGKSSLIKLITHEYRPVALHDGRPVVEILGRHRWNVFELRSLLGIVSPDVQNSFTETVNRKGLSGLDVVVSGFFASHGVQRHQNVTPDMWDRARNALALLDVADLEQKSMVELSTGEARRILIARALVTDPPALLLDEPTGGLDLVARHRFLQTIRTLASGGKTIIMVTHRLEEILPEIDHVVLLRAGHVLYAGPKDEALTNARLSLTFGAPLHVERLTDGSYIARPDPNDPTATPCAAAPA